MVNVIVMESLVVQFFSPTCYLITWTNAEGSRDLLSYPVDGRKNRCTQASTTAQFSSDHAFEITLLTSVKKSNLRLIDYIIVYKFSDNVPLHTLSNVTGQAYRFCYYKEPSSSTGNDLNPRLAYSTTSIES